MLRLFVDNLLPVFLVAGAGYLLAARSTVSLKSVSHLAFYVLAPCLVFRVLVDHPVPLMEFARMGLFTGLGLALLGGTAALAAWRLGWSRKMVAAVTLVALLPNAGNLGLSVNLLAFGEPGLAAASLYFVSSSVMTYTAGVLVASLGRAGILRSLAGLVRVPSVWAVPLGLLVMNTGLALPGPADRAVDLLAAACIPVFLLVLGMQLHAAHWKQRPGPLILGSGLRLGGGILAGILFAGLLGLEGPSRQAGIAQAGMPSAVINIILATEYDVEPEFVTAAVLVTTLLCPFTLTPLLAYLGA